MNVRDVMTENPACCSADASILDVAKLMVDCDCGEIPVTDNDGRPIGVVTDRDICCRAIAKGKDLNTRANEVMSSPVVTIGPDESIESCMQLMDDNQIRRVPVVDSSGICCGIVAQADIARKVSDADAGHVVRDISQPSEEPSRAKH